MKVATFILTNGSDEQKKHLLDQHLESLLEREAEIIQPRRSAVIDEREASRSEIKQMEM